MDMLVTAILRVTGKKKKKKAKHQVKVLLLLSITVVKLYLKCIR